MDDTSREIKKEIEDKIMTWQKQLDDKDSRINSLIEEKELLKKEIARKLIMSPALKERLMGDVGRLLANMKNDLRKRAVKERDISSRLEAAREKINALTAEIAAQNSIIEKLKADKALLVTTQKSEIVSLSAEHEKQKAAALKKQAAEFEKTLHAQAKDASKQMDMLMKEISDKE